LRGRGSAGLAGRARLRRIAGRSPDLSRDRYAARPGALRLRDRQDQLAVLEARLRLVRLDRARKRERPAERAEPPLAQVVGLALVLALVGPVLPADRDRVAVGGDVDVVRLPAGQRGAELVALVGLVHVDADRQHAGARSGAARADEAL